MALEAVPVDPAGPDARALVHAFQAEIVARYGDIRGETPDAAFRPPDGRALVLHDALGAAVAFGALEALEAVDGERVAELRRLYVVPEHRGRGTGRALLAALEAAAAEAGYARARMDTGARQPEALGLFRSAGWSEIADFNGNPLAAHWFEKRLSAPA